MKYWIADSDKFGEQDPDLPLIERDEELELIKSLFNEMSV